MIVQLPQKAFSTLFFVIGILFIETQWIPPTSAQSTYPILEPCSLSEYQTLFGYTLAEFGNDPDTKQDPIDIWQSKYHSTMNDMVSHHMKDINNETAPNCTADTLANFSPPGSTLSFVASNLPPWKNPTDFARLSEDDFGAVILEYVNAYECVLRERGYSLAIDVTREEFQWSDIIFGAGLTPIILEKITKETADQQEKIDRELLTARAIANRVLEFVGGFNRLLTLDKELQCMQRASLDFRNAFAIAAETSSCLPRIWNAKDSLRDICDDPLRCDPQP